MEFKSFGYVADVGHGSCNIIVFDKSPSGIGNRAVVIDVGPKGSVHIVIDLLRKADVTWIEALILTHNDQDHVGGLCEVFGEYENRIGEIYYSGDRDHEENWVYESIENYVELGLIETEPENVCIMKQDFVVRFDSSNAICFIGPSGHFAYGAQGKDVNACSVISILEIDGKRLMFPGDAVIESFKSVYRRKKKKRRAFVDLLVAPHHGGMIAKNRKKEKAELNWLFEKFVVPGIVVFSVGTLRGNQYGLPRKKLLDCLAEKKVPFVCTEATENCCGREISELFAPEISSWTHPLPSHSCLRNSAIPCVGTLYFELDQWSELDNINCTVCEG